jgi:hypothetical protein
MLLPSQTGSLFETFLEMLKNFINLSPSGTHQVTISWQPLLMARCMYSMLAAPRCDHTELKCPLYVAIINVVCKQLESFFEMLTLLS